MKRVLTGILTCGMMAQASVAQPSGTDRFWLLWERSQPNSHCMTGSTCGHKRNYTTRLITPKNPTQLHQIFELSDDEGMQPQQHPEAPEICPPHSALIAKGYNAETMEESAKIEVLRELKAIGVDLSGLRAPPGHSSQFGQTVHDRAVAILAQAGLQVVDMETAKTLPGKPRLNIYFSHTGDTHNCEYSFSVFASLSQTVVLSRDLNVKVSAGVWSKSTGSKKFVPGREGAAIISIIDALARDYISANIP